MEWPLSPWKLGYDPDPKNRAKSEGAEPTVIVKCAMPLSMKEWLEAQPEIPSKLIRWLVERERARRLKIIEKTFR